MAVFPVLGTYGNTDETEYIRTRRRYADGTKRFYKISNFKHRRLTLRFDRVKTATRNAVQAFLDAREADMATFTVYNPQETQTLDLSGASSTGRHTADEIIGDTWSWTQDDYCRFSGEVTVFLID